MNTDNMSFQNLMLTRRAFLAKSGASLAAIATLPMLAEAEPAVPNWRFPVDDLFR